MRCTRVLATGAILVALLLASAATAAEDRWAFYALSGVGFSRTSGGGTYSDWPVFTIGAGYAVNRRFAVETMASYRQRTEALAHGADERPYPEREIMRIASLTLGATFHGMATPSPYASLATGLYTFGTYYRPKGFGSRSTMFPGFSIAGGMEPVGRWGARLDVRCHVLHPDQPLPVPGQSIDHWFVMYEATLGAQLP